jgi:hypothetical protein
VIALNLFVAIIPLIIIGYAFIEAFNPHRDVGSLFVSDLHLTGSTASIVKNTFSRTCMRRSARGEPARSPCVEVAGRPGRTCVTCVPERAVESASLDEKLRSLLLPGLVPGSLGKADRQSRDLGQQVSTPRG